MLFVDSVLVYMPVTSDGVTSNPGLEFGSLIWAVSEPPSAPATKLPPRTPLFAVELIVQTVLSTLAVKFPPLLCAQTAEEPNNATAEMARQGSTTLVIIELFFMIIFYCCAAPKAETAD
jgi:hypothetical protein